ncbi:MAG TPA: hypothetical protein VNW50_05015 [Streptosporangiaceae bacterium]|jgi:hypothetical protein|nr:hypothetical protein [Streptosporangiaceae bacterium]
MSQPEHAVITEGRPPPPRAPGTPARVLSRALRIVDAGPRPFFQAALSSLTVACILAIAIAVEIRPAGPLPAAQRDVIMISLAALGLVGVLTAVTVLVPASVRAALVDRFVAPSQRAAIWLALALWFPLLAIIAYYRSLATLPLTQVWINFGYTDKRWLSAAYLIGALAPMALLVAVARVLEAGRAHPATWRAWLRDLAPRRLACPITASPVAADTVTADTETAGTVTADAGTADTRAGESAAHRPRLAFTAPRRGGTALRLAAGLLTALGLAYYFYGPPWYVNRTSGALPMLFQEEVYLTGFQAISKGAVPYIGPAAVQYGPGSQWFTYEYMRHFATFSVVGFRESWAMFEWVGASFLFVVFFLALGYFRGLVAALLSALIYPALHQLEFVPGKAYTGLFAWANPLRYAGAIALLLLLPAAIRRAPAWRGVLGAFVLGLVWGFMSYVGQENLAAGAVGAIVLSAVLLFSGSASARAVVTSLVSVLGGFVVAWLPVVLFYAGKGLLGRFVYLYFLDVRATAQGYSNTPWGGVDPTPGNIKLDAPWAHMYHVLPFVLAVLVLLAVLQFRPFRVAMEWSKDRIQLVSCLVTTILLYQGALLRADADHITGTMLAVPLLVVAVATALPRLLGGRRLLTLGLAGAVLFAASFLLLPVDAYTFSNIGRQAAAPTLDRQRLGAEKVPATPATMADRRVGAGLWARHNCCRAFSEPMSQFVSLANELHAIIGNRVTYVENFMAGYVGAIYFVADLRPAPVPLDLSTMVFTEQQKAAYVANFRTSVLPETRALVTGNLDTAQVRDFEQRYPHYQRIKLEWHHHAWHPHPYWVLLSSPDRSGQFPG